MTTPEFTYHYPGPGNSSASSLTLTYPDDKTPGRIKLELADHIAPSDASAAIAETRQFAEALHFKVIEDKEKPNTIIAETGSRLPDGMGLLVSHRLVETNLVSSEHAHGFMEALIQHENQQEAAQQKTVDPLAAAMQHSDMASIIRGLAQSRAVLTEMPMEHDPARENAAAGKAAPSPQAGRGV